MLTLQRGFGVCCLIAQVSGFTLGVRALMCAPDILARHPHVPTHSASQRTAEPRAGEDPAASAALASGDCEHRDSDRRGATEDELPRSCPFSAPGSCTAGVSLPAPATATPGLLEEHTLLLAAATNPVHNLPGDAPFHPPRA